MNIRTKFLAVMLSLVLITGVAAILIGQTVSTSIIEEQVGNHLETTAQSRAHHVETVLAEYKQAAGMLAAGIPFRNVVDKSKNYTENIEMANLRINNTIQSYEDISRIRVLDESGIVIASSHADVGYDKSASETFLRGREEVHIRELHTSCFTGNDVMSVAAPILVDGKFSGVIIVNFNAEKIFKITTDRTGLGEIGEIYLLNRDGYMITPPRFITDTLPKQDVDQKHFIGTENYEPEAVLYEDYRGVDVLGAHAPIPAMNWCLVAEIDEEEAFAPVARLTTALFLILAVLLLVGAVICTRVSGTITDPIVKLYRGTEEIVKGNLDYKVGTETVDEVGELSRAFDTMTANLKESGRELKEYSRGLETNVEERTARLDELLTASERQRAAIVNIAHDLKDANIELSAEIDERKSAEARIEHLNNVLKAVRDVNKLIVTEKERGSLIKKACDILTETRGYEAAWLGSLGNGETFDMVVGSGFREDVDRFSKTVMGGNHPPCVKKALAGKEMVVVMDKSGGCGDCPFRDAHDGRKNAVIRVERGGKLFGLLAISFAADVTFDEEEAGLLVEVASDIALALRNMEMEEAHKSAEDRIKASLKEKEVLLREIHHRVKNNLQVVSSLLDMQARHAVNEDSIDVLTESKNRINAMALIHAQLYESRDLAEINMKSFVDKLLMQLFQSYPVQGAQIKKTVSIADYPVPISMAVPVGLIVNELLSNALKHAFAGRKEGELKVNLTASEEGRINLTVSDDGVGLPAGFDIDKTGTLGLRLIKILTEDQLRGTLEIVSDGGATFNIEFDLITNDEA